MAVFVFGGLLLVVLAVTWFALGDDVRATFSVLQRITLVILGLMLFACYHALVRSRVVATEAGLTVVNGYRTRRYEWSQILAVQLGRGAPWGTLDLNDGETVVDDRRAGQRRRPGATGRAGDPGVRRGAHPGRLTAASGPWEGGARRPGST